MTVALLMLNDPFRIVPIGGPEFGITVTATLCSYPYSLEEQVLKKGWPD